MKRIFPGHDIISAIDFAFIALLLVFAGVWAWHEYITSPPYVSEVRYPVRGFDISSHNGMINFDAAANDGMEFVFIKASEGTDYRDSNFKINYDKAKRAGLKIGVYHYFRFDKDGIDQAMHFFNTVGNRELDLGYAIDVEEEGNLKGVSPDSVKSRLRDMIEYINLKGYRTILYSNRNGFYDFLYPEFEGMPVWICSFNSDPINADFDFWQFSHRGRIKGVNGNVDMNAFGGSREDWRQFLLDSKIGRTNNDGSPAD